MTEADKIKAFADRFANLLDGHKADVETLVEQVKAADLDPPTLKKIVAAMRQDATKRAEKEALFDQYLFLAGLAPTPAELPAESEIAKARALFADDMSIREVAKAMGISPTKAHALKVKGSAFDVPVPKNANTPAGSAEEISLKPKPACISPLPATWEEITLSRDAHEAAWKAEAEAKEAARLAAIEAKRKAREALAERNRQIDADALDIPADLDRRHELRTA